MCVRVFPAPCVRVLDRYQIHVWMYEEKVHVTVNEKTMKSPLMD